MSEDRRSLIEELGKLRKSNVISYLTSDRVPYAAQIALDTIPIFYKHLKLLGRAKKISLFLSSNGGSLDAPWPIVGLIREYCDELEVIIPGRALSAATLIALGADKIVMGPASYLSPIDPRGTFEKDGQRQEIEIENIFGFVDFAREQVGLKGEEALSVVVKQLAEHINPIALGSANRAYYLIRSLARRLLLLHMNHQKDEARIEHIVKNLAQRLYSHSHLIYRSEARDDLGFGECIEYPNSQFLDLIDELYLSYVELLGIGRPFNPSELWDIQALQSNQALPVSVTRAIIESINFSDSFETMINALLDPQNGQFRIGELESGWKETRYEQPNN